MFARRVQVRVDSTVVRVCRDRFPHSARVQRFYVVGGKRTKGRSQKKGGAKTTKTRFEPLLNFFDTALY